MENIKAILILPANKGEQSNWVFATNSDFLIPISLLSGGVNIWYFKLRLFDQTELMRSSTLGCEDRDYKMRVCGKDSIPLKSHNSLITSWEAFFIEANIFSTFYSAPIDIWAVGCIMAELYTFRY